MLTSQKREFWFVVGSQHLYGPEALNEVESHAKEIVDALNDEGNFSFPIKFKALVTTADEIKNVMKDVNYQDEVAGVITWMHTFSPAKMWIPGTKLLQKPLLHLSTQFNKEIPWETIDMDFMNLNQSAHGDREYGFINARLNIKNKVVVGHYQDEEVHKEMNNWMLSAVGYAESQNIKVARFGDNMRNVAVTEGDKVEAAIQFGWTVDYFGIGDLVAEMDKVSDEDIQSTYDECQDLYDMTPGDNEADFYEAHVKEQIKIEIGLRRFLEEGGYTAFTTNFEDLHGMKQLPGMAVQRLNAEGYGFAGEGDWKTAALDRLVKVMANNESTGFMEDYTYNMAKGNEYIVQSHMLEVDPTFAETKPRVVVNPLGIGDKEDPARLVFDGKAGEGFTISMLDLGTHYRLMVNTFEAVTPEEEAPNLPVARVIWKPNPDFKTSIKKWIEAGGGHHTVATLALDPEVILDWAQMVDLETVVID
ncbi:L-arabinose isomerase [Alkalibacterium putridalgicola]|uniref:L-arabinose isomerase n=1 Tax=Alkalibacterium putridalgicola TaxID=426703 RepID=A0A1H7RBA3_9LACT|nr:L-arabinose isomerase [Alkalibacterium putridalgicola]GEK88826.1 L-arabinose isomerase 1 [Alkalibacterium putridalgicola]SEL57546.1 L-arabinose isomerase [Alkalibacterium putridalgicola]